MNYNETTNTTTAPGNECRQLDGYLDGELKAEERLAFEKHLSQCAECREAVEQQVWIDDLLQSSDAAEEESLSVSAGVAARKAILSARRRTHVRRSLIAATAAACIAVIALHYVAAPPHAAPGDARGSKHQAIVQRDTIRQQSWARQNMTNSEPEATFVTDGAAIAVPLASGDAQVSIVQLYPTTTTQRRWQRESTQFAGRAGQDGG
jgi:predicted anti-sigma-YlaC factor YlaD